MAEIDVKTDPKLKWDCVDVIPDGEYVAAVIKSEVRMSRSRRSRYMRLLLRIERGEFLGCQIQDESYLMHPQLRRMLTGKGKLSTLAAATRVPMPSDTSEFHGIPIRIIVRNRYDRNGRPTSEVREWKECYE